MNEFYKENDDENYEISKQNRQNTIPETSYTNQASELDEEIKDLLYAFFDYITNQNLQNDSAIDLSYRIYEVSQENIDLVINIVLENNLILNIDDPQTIFTDNLRLLSSIMNFIGELCDHSKYISDYFYQHNFFPFCMKFISESEYEMINSSLHIVSSFFMNNLISLEENIGDILVLIDEYNFISTNSPLYNARILYSICKYYDYKPYLKKIVSIAETLRNASEGEDQELDEIIAQMCILLLKKDRTFITTMDRGQLLGGLQESLEIQYPLMNFTEDMQHFQVTMFELLNEVIKSTNRDHAISIIQFIPATFIENVLENSTPLVVVPLLEILSFVLEGEKYSPIGAICFKPNIIRKIISSHGYSSYSSKVQLSHLISEILKKGSLELISFILEGFEENENYYNYIKICLPLLEGEENGVLYFLRSLYLMIQAFPKEENPVIKLLHEENIDLELLDDLQTSENEEIAEYSRTILTYFDP